MALIYVVEDDKNIQEIETFALTNVGYRVEGFESAEEFYEALNREIPDLILLDVATNHRHLCHTACREQTRANRPVSQRT